jgi:diguanylate cyclase (GGDEF)-like protein
MSLSWYIISAMVICGAGVPAFSFLLATRIISELPASAARGWWQTLRVLIIFFIAGYLAYWVLGSSQAGWGGLVVGGVFLAGALFVLLVCWLMLRTVKDIKRMAELERENITDQLLGIYNRRYLDQRLKEETVRAQRYKAPLALLMLDIDHFKKVNDRYGHQVGDRVLTGIGKLLMAHIRQSDLAARYGGEEVAVVLPNTGEASAYIMAERLRQVVEQTPFSAGPDGARFNVTVSIGLATLGDTQVDSHDLITCADAALYHAKRSGRNRVSIYESAFKEELSFKAAR